MISIALLWTLAASFVMVKIAIGVIDGFRELNLTPHVILAVALFAMVSTGAVATLMTLIPLL